MKRYDEYKDSGVAWIGEIPGHWSVLKISRICKVITDYVASGSFADLAKNVTYLDEPDYAMLVRTADVSGKGHSTKPVYVNKHSYDFLSNSNLFGGEIMLPNVGGVGEVYMVPKLYERMTLAPNAIIIRTTQCDRFYYYFFSSEGGSMSLINLSRVTAQPKFNKTDFRKLTVPLPYIEEQREIAEYLDTECGKIDVMIEKQRRRIDLLQELKQSLITRAITRGLNPNATMRDSGVAWIGELPTHWKISKIKWEYTFSTGGTPSTKIDKYYEGDILWANISDLGDKYIYDTQRKITQAGVNDCCMTISPKGSLLYAFKLSVGTVSFCGTDMYTNEAIATFRSKYNNLGYLYYASNMIIYNSNTNIYGAKLLNQELIRNAIIPIPPLSEQREIAEYLDTECEKIDGMIEKQRRRIDLLQELKQSLITEAVTGKRKVI